MFWTRTKTAKMNSTNPLPKSKLATSRDNTNEKRNSNMMLETTTLQPPTAMVATTTAKAKMNKLKNKTELLFKPTIKTSSKWAVVVSLESHGTIYKCIRRVIRI